jgi:hypothetical protein
VAVGEPSFRRSQICPEASLVVGQLVSIREVDEDIRQVSFLQYDLGHFDKERDRV